MMNPDAVPINPDAVPWGAPQSGGRAAQGEAPLK